MNEYRRKLHFFSHLQNGKKDKNSGSHIFRASMYSFDFNTAIYIGTPRARSNIAQKRCFKMTKFRNNAFPGVLYRFFFCFSFSLGFRLSVRIVAHRRSRRNYLARGGLISQTGGTFARCETRSRKSRICIKTLVFCSGRHERDTRTRISRRRNDATGGEGLE